MRRKYLLVVLLAAIISAMFWGGASLLSKPARPWPTPVHADFNEV